MFPGLSSTNKTLIGSDVMAFFLAGVSQSSTQNLQSTSQPGQTIPGRPASSRNNWHRGCPVAETNLLQENTGLGNVSLAIPQFIQDWGRLEYIMHQNSTLGLCEKPNVKDSQIPRN
jgi:hypothetical protein